MRKLIGAGAAVFLAVALAGCTSYSSKTDGELPENPPQALTIITKTLSDGTILECAYITDTDGRSGFDCNWEGVTAERTADEKSR